MTAAALAASVGLGVVAGVAPVTASAAPAPVPTPAASAAATADAPAQQAPGRWRTAGRWIVDEQGRVVITHGVNEVEKNPPFAPDAIGFGEDDAAFLAAQGFTSVRLGVPWEAVEPEPGEYDDAYLDRIAGTVATLHRHGIASLLDFHQDMANTRFQGNGWPHWAVRDRGLPNVVKAGFPANYFLNEALKYAYDDFYDNAPAPDGVGVADHYAAAWGHVAARFADEPGVMGYDLYNEPFPGHGYTACLTAFGCPRADARLSVVQQKAHDAIRRADRATTVWYEPNQFFNVARPTHVRVKGGNVGLSFHDYCTSQAVLHNYVGCERPDSEVFANAERHAKDTGSGLLLTEFGAITSAKVLNEQTDLAARNRVGWQYWAYTGGDPTTAGPGREQALVFDPTRPPAGDNVDALKLASLAIPHPDRVAGMPVTYGYDRKERVFRMSWESRRPEGGVAGPSDETIVRIPESLASAGYEVQIDGGRVYSAAHSRELRLRLAPGVLRANVTVRFAGA